MSLNQEIFANEHQTEEPRVYSVAELTRDIKAILEAAFDSIWVEGEISNLRVAASKHSYFVLKDDKAQIRCVLFKNYRAGLKYDPEDGDQVLLLGRATVYDSRGEYQLIVETMEPRGLGALQKAYEQLKAKLAKQGLFDEDKKKSLPEFPWKVGVITSPTGAAVRDIHRGCSKVLKDHLTLEAVMPGQEDDKVTIPVGFDPGEVKLVGAVAGEPPFRGVLRHHGWRVTDASLPTLTGEANRNILAPAQVEMS